MICQLPQFLLLYSPGHHKNRVVFTVAAGLGIEPRFRGSEPRCLPLADPAKCGENNNYKQEDVILKRLIV